MTPLTRGHAHAHALAHMQTHPRTRAGARAHAGARETTSSEEVEPPTPPSRDAADSRRKNPKRGASAEAWVRRCAPATERKN